MGAHTIPVNMSSDEMSAFKQDLQEIRMSTSSRSITPKSVNAQNFFNLHYIIDMLYLKIFISLEESKLNKNF